MKKHTVLIYLIIFVLALILRSASLSTLPYGFHVDEAKAGWNAYTILKTGHDDQGHFLPLYYNSFGDFRPTGIIYLILPTLIFFGNTILATRLPAALFGALSVIPLMLIFGQIARDKDKKWYWIPGLLLTVNPWHLMVSRATSEVIIALFLALFSIYFFVKTIKKATWGTVFWSLFFVGLSYLFYHSIRVIAPLFLITMAIFYWPKIKINQNLKPILAIILGSVLLTAIFFWSPQARGRLGQVTLINDPKIRLETINMPNEEGPGHVLLARSFHNRPLVILKNMVNEYSNYFGINFLTGDNARPNRYRTQNFGLITYVEFLLIALSLVAAGAKKEVWLVWLLLLISPIPAAITNEDTPNLHRALFMIPFLVLLETYGLMYLFSLKKWARFFTITILLALFFNLIYFAHFYIIHQKFGMPSYYRNGGAKELTAKVYMIHDQYAKVIVTNSPDSLYPWFGFFNKIEPKSFSQTVNENGNIIWSWKNVTFSNEKCPSEKIAKSKDKISEKILIIDGEGCEIDPILAKKQNIIKLRDMIRRPDLSNAFVFWEVN